LTAATLLGDLGKPLGDPLAGRAILELVLLGASGGALGAWVVLYGFSYSAESLSHSMLPGLVVATLVGGSLVLGGMIAAMVAALAMVAARQMPGLGSDTAVAVVVTTLFGAGVLLALTPSSPAGLANLLFGDVLGTTDGDLVLAGVTAALVGTVLFVLHPRLLASGFDRDAAPALGISPRLAEATVLVLTAVVVVVAVQALGNLLVLAILVAPAMTARRLTRRVAPMMIVAIALAGVGGVAGIYVSYYVGAAAGASVALALVALYSVAGVVARVRKPT
jgi:ABC-type Mn2+/Zn2+ transport system permease subunit